ncbi:MAG: hypothetical protein ACPGN3_18240 [Opitutales bacterium]
MKKILITSLAVALSSSLQALVNINAFGEQQFNNGYTAFAADSFGSELIDGTNAVMLIGTFASGSSFVSGNSGNLETLAADFTLLGQTNTVAEIAEGFPVSGVYTGSVTGIDTTLSPFTASVDQTPYLWVLSGISSYSGVSDLSSVTGHSIVQSSTWGTIASSGPDAVPPQEILFENDTLSSGDVLVGSYDALGFSGVAPLISAQGIGAVPEPAEISLLFGFAAIGFAAYRSRKRKNQC